MYTRRLWLSIGFHFAWNFTQSGIFSGIVSGTEASQDLIRFAIKGPDLLTGGNFGVESTILALAVCTSTGIYMIIKAYRAGKIIAPMWRRE